MDTKFEMTEISMKFGQYIAKDQIPNFLMSITKDVEFLLSESTNMVVASYDFSSLLRLILEEVVRQVKSLHKYSTNPFAVQVLKEITDEDLDQCLLSTTLPVMDQSRLVSGELDLIRYTTLETLIMKWGLTYLSV